MATEPWNVTSNKDINPFSRLGVALTALQSGELDYQQVNNLQDQYRNIRYNYNPNYKGYNPIGKGDDVKNYQTKFNKLGFNQQLIQPNMSNFSKLQNGVTGDWNNTFTPDFDKNTLNYTIFTLSYISIKLIMMRLVYQYN